MSARMMLTIAAVPPRPYTKVACSVKQREALLMGLQGGVAREAGHHKTCHQMPIMAVILLISRHQLHIRMM